MTASSLTLKLISILGQSYLIQRAEGADSYGKRSVITFSDIALNPPLAGKLFQYEPPEGARVVPNPLVREE